MSLLISLVSSSQVVADFCDNWEGLANKWAAFGRMSQVDPTLQANNHLERHQGVVKYVFFDGKKFTRLVPLLICIIGEIIPFYISDRLKKLAGIESSERADIMERHKENCKVLVSKEGIKFR